MRFTANFHDDGASFDASASETGSSFDAQIADGHASFDAEVSTGAEKFPASVQDNNSAFGVNFAHYVENNTGGGGGAAVLYTPMELNEDQKQQARDNIGAIDRGFETVSVFAREDGTYFANVTYRELVQHLAAGKALYAMLDGVRYPLVQSVGTWLYFGKMNLPSGTGTTWHYTYIAINSSDKVLVTKPQIPITAITLTGLDRKKLVYVNRDNELESLELDEAMRVENGTLLLDDAIKQPGPQGDPGPPGKDGTAVTVSSVVESTEDGGENIVTFSDDTVLVVRNGNKGSDGEGGSGGGGGGIHVGSEAPTDEAAVVWIDPSADADIRSELVADVIAMLPVYGGETA